MIHMNGSSKNITVSSGTGQVIKCTVDLRESRNKVTWEKDSILIAERELP